MLVGGRRTQQTRTRVHRAKEGVRRRRSRRSRLIEVPETKIRVHPRRLLAARGIAEVLLDGLKLSLEESSVLLTHLQRRLRL